MPIYSYECSECGNALDVSRPMADRDGALPCRCGTNMKRVWTMPTVFIDKAGNVDDRSDEFWERSERIRQKGQKRRKDEEMQKMRYGDKETRRKSETAMQNYRRQGLHEDANELERKVR